MAKTRVFVYGTLKKGNSIRGLDKLCANARFIGEAETSDNNYSLYDLGAFPAACSPGVNRIRGEVWEIDNELLTEQLDAIEGYPHFYTRDKIQTTHGSAWMYHIKNIKQYNGMYIVAQHGEAVAWSN